jgi:hypothetical protein
MVGQYQNISLAMQENKLLQMSVGKQQAMGELYKTPGAVDPDGTVHYDKLISAAAQSGDPYANMLTGDLLKEGQEANTLTTYTDSQGTSHTATRQDAQKYAQGGQAPAQTPVPQDHIDFVHDSYQNVIKPTLLNLINDPSLNQKKIINAATDICSPNTAISVPQVCAQLKDVPPDSDPQGQKQWLQNLYNQTAANHLHLAAMHPHSSTMQPQGQPPGIAGPAPGTLEQAGQSTARVSQANTDQSNYANQNAALDNIYNLSKQGTPSGTAIADAVQAFGKTGLAPSGVTATAANMQEMGKYMEQAAIAAGMPNSDARLAAIEAANTHPEQLPGAIQALIPFLKAQNDTKAAKANFYRQNGVDGTNAQAEMKANGDWQTNFTDTRGAEVAKMPKAERIKYLTNLPKINPAAADKVVSSAKFIKPYLP